MAARWPPIITAMPASGLPLTTPTATPSKVDSNEIAVGAAIVFNRFTLAFDELVHAFALLSKKRRRVPDARHQTKLVALGVLANFELPASNDNAALGQHHPSTEHTELLDIVVAQRICLDIHRLAAVGLLGPS